MEPKLLVFLVVILGFSSTCTATTYMVGDNSGWDISTDLDSWTTGKQFQVGDVLGNLILSMTYLSIIQILKIRCYVIH